MIPSERDKLFQVVPIGEENAASIRTIRQNLGLWSTNGIRGNLNWLAERGLICRKLVPAPRWNVTMFYRQPDAAAAHGNSKT